MNLSKICVIIPVHNRIQTTQKCLLHLKRLSLLGRIRIAVVDDGSSDGTREMLVSEFPEVEIVAGDGSLFWTGAIRAGMEYAADSGAEGVLWLNDDVTLTSGVVESLVAESERRAHQAIIAPLYEVEETGEIIGESLRSGSCDPDVKELDYEAGYCVFVPKSVWHRIGFPDAEGFRHYGGDSEFTQRATIAGIQCLRLFCAKVQLEDNPAEQYRLDRWIFKGDRLSDGLRSTFLNVKSPFNLQSWFRFHQIRYGRILGLIRFILKFFVLAIRSAAIILSGRKHFRIADANA